jgi:hypothetical protein
MSYPRFLGDAFPAELTHYTIPLFRPCGSGRTIGVLSVDWEKDHGRWRQEGGQTSYGGVLRGTSILCDLLDELAFPCTWFVECNGVHPAADMPTVAPRVLESIAARAGDEVGMHVHWGNYESPEGGPVDLYDGLWVTDTIAAAMDRLRRACDREVVSFRSGGHIAVPALPRILDELGYRCDGSVEDRRSSFWRRMHTMVSWSTDAYHPRPDSLLQVGDCPVLEIPTSLHLHGFDALQRVWPRLFPRRHQRVISVYLHIDELTQPQSGSDSAACIDRKRLAGLRSLLRHWREQPDLEWMTAQEAAKRLVTVPVAPAAPESAASA